MPNWTDCHCSPNGSIIDLGNNISAALPGFVDLNGQDFTMQNNGNLINQGMNLLPAVLPEHDINQEYVKHQSTRTRIESGRIDIGAYEFCDELSCDLIFANGFEE